MSVIVTALRASRAAYLAFEREDGWAIASHIALSALMSLFPFLIFVTALAGMFDVQSLADQVAMLLLEAWPEEVSGPLAREVERVLTTPHGGLLTIGGALALYFSSSAIDGLRIGLNRSYAVVETRSWWLLRLESIAWVAVGAVALIALSFLILLAPLIHDTLLRWFPDLAVFTIPLTLARFTVATFVLVVALVLVHLWLPAGRRTLRDIAPGVAVTLALWLVTGVVFGRYLARFAEAYVSTYAGLASAMIALVFLYWTASIFVYGGAFNQAMSAWRAPVSPDDSTTEAS